MVIVADQVKRLQEQGWTLSAMADELKVNRQTLARWRNGTHEPHHANLVAHALTQLLRNRDVPKKRRYVDGRLRRDAVELQSQRAVASGAAQLLPNGHGPPEQREYQEIIGAWGRRNRERRARG